MSTQEVIRNAYRILQQEFGAEPGDKVTIVRGYGKEEAEAVGFMGTGLWREFNRMIGRTLPVVEVGTHYIALPNPGRIGRQIFAPFFCLKLIKKPQEPLSEVSFEEDGLTVKGVFISKDTIRRNLNL